MKQNKRTECQDGDHPPIRVNNTCRIVFNQEAAKRIGRPKFMDVIIHGHIVRLVPTNEASDNSLEMGNLGNPTKGMPYTFTAERYLKPLGFEGGKGAPSYPIFHPKPYGDRGYEFRFPPLD